MFSTQISIQNKLAVRDGFVEIPDAMRFRQALTRDEVLVLIPGSVAKRESSSKYRISDEEWIELPAYDKAVDPTPTDWYQTLRTAAAAKTIV